MKNEHDEIIASYFAGPVSLLIEGPYTATVIVGEGGTDLCDLPQHVQEALLLQWLQAYREFHDQLDRETDCQRRGIPVIRGVLGRGGGQW
ncbi:hypothetical protein BAE30_06295 [Acidithiobacillus caldus]|uniref:Uncharacterized protein n=1 Tax=Acidithiobacillus caldus TaxID=33059 RepID=A0A1E7YWY4_9PROT|nr:hypothetical protein BAE30_06295 [Acidithiobacillus caldus]